MDSFSLAALGGCLVVAAIYTVLALVHALVRVKPPGSTSHKDQAIRFSTRVEPAEKTDTLAVLRSPYKPAPLCGRCLAMRHSNGSPYFVCRMNERCGLRENENAC